MCNLLQIQLIILRPNYYNFDKRSRCRPIIQLHRQKKLKMEVIISLVFYGLLKMYA